MWKGELQILLWHDEYLKFAVELSYLFIEHTNNLKVDEPMFDLNYQDSDTDVYKELRATLGNKNLKIGHKWPLRQAKWHPLSAVKKLTFMSEGLLKLI